MLGLGLVFGLGLGLVMTVQILTVLILTIQIKTGNPFLYSPIRAAGLDCDECCLSADTCFQATNMSCQKLCQSAAV